MTLPIESVPCPLCGAPREEADPFAEGTDFEYGTTSETFRFVRCRRCTLVYLSPRPALSALSTIYPPDYYSFTGEEEGRGLVKALRARWERGKVRDYARFLPPGKRRVLDAGCGRGRFLSILQRAGSPDWELWGIDLDADAIAAARAKGFHAHVSTVDAFEPGVRFDLIVLQQVIEHVANPVAVLAKLGRLLAPGGVAVLETPNLAGWDFRLFRRSLWGGYHFPRHWTLFDRTTLRELARRAGVEVVAIESLMSLSFWSWSIHHVLKTTDAPAFLTRGARPPSLPLLLLSAPIEVLQLALRMETSNQRLIARARIASSVE